MTESPECTPVVFLTHLRTWCIFHACSAMLQFIFSKSNGCIRRSRVTLSQQNSLMDFLRGFPLQKKELNHSTNCNFFHFALSLEALEFKQLPNNQLVSELLVIIEYSSLQMKLHDHIYRCCGSIILICKPSYLSNQPSMLGNIFMLKQ